jgi:hypothetical protein
MGNMKLKNGIKVSKNVQGDYIFEQLINANNKKITSRAFACLLGKNTFESAGKTILERCNMVEKETIDPYYTVRGAIGEHLIEDYFIDVYKKYKKMEIKVLSWDAKSVNFDNFAKNPMFGGLLDRAISEPKEERAVIEVKSKSLKDYAFIDGKKGVEEEVLQGKFLSALSKTETCHMAYIFFDEQQETLLKNYVKDLINLGDNVNNINAKDVIKALNWRYELFKIKVYKHVVDFKEIDELMQESNRVLRESIQSGVITSEMFTVSEINYLDDLVYGDGVRPVNVLNNDKDNSDLPF